MKTVRYDIEATVLVPVRVKLGTVVTMQDDEDRLGNVWRAWGQGMNGEYHDAVVEVEELCEVVDVNGQGPCDQEALDNGILHALSKGMEEIVVHNWEERPAD